MSPKFTGPGSVSTRNLLVLKNFLQVLNIRMEEIRFVEHKINLPLRLNFQRHRAENVFRSLISTKLDRHGYQPTTCLNPRNFFFHNVWNVLFRLSLSYLWPFVSCCVFFIMQFIVVSITSRSVNLKKI